MKTRTQIERDVRELIERAHFLTKCLRLAMQERDWSGVRDFTDELVATDRHLDLMKHDLCVLEACEIAFD